MYLHGTIRLFPESFTFVCDTFHSKTLWWWWTTNETVNEMSWQNGLNALCLRNSCARMFFFFIVEIKCYQMLPVETHLKMCFRNKMTYLKDKTNQTAVYCGDWQMWFYWCRGSRLILTYLPLGHQFSLRCRSGFDQGAGGGGDGLGGLEDLLLKVQALVSLLFTREETQQPINTPLLGC